MRRLSVMAALIHLLGCAVATMPTSREMTAINRGEKVIVLLRVEITTDTHPYAPFGDGGENIILVLGTFKTGGKPRDVATPRFLSPESRLNGWAYLVLPPGTSYLAVCPSWYVYNTSLSPWTDLRSDICPRWRIDIPADAKLVYVGTLHLTGEVESLFLLTIRMASFRTEQLTVDDDSEPARKLLAEHFPAMGEARVISMQRFEGGPIILRSPLGR